MCRKRICDPYARKLIKAATPGKANWAIENSVMKLDGESRSKTPNACQQARGRRAVLIVDLRLEYFYIQKPWRSRSCGSTT